MATKKQLATCMFRMAATLVIAGLALTMVGIAAPLQLTIDYHTSLAQDIANFVKIYYPDIELKFVDRPTGSLSAMTMRQWFSDKNVDISYHALNAMHTWQRDLSIYSSLDPFIDKGRFDLSGYKGLQQYMQVEGKTHFLPLDIRPFLVYYNRALFDQHGVAYPAPGWTWEGFRSIVMKLNNHQSAKAVKLHPNILRLMFLQSTDDILTVSRTAITKAVSLLAEMLNEQSVAIEYGPLNSLMKVDQIVKVNYPNPAIGFAPLPVFSETDRYTPTEIWGFAVPASSKQPEAAWKVAALLTGPEGAAFFSTFGYITGYRNSEVEKSLLTRMDPGLARMITTLRPSMLTTPPTVEGRSFQNTFITMQKNLAQGTVTLEEALAAILDSHAKL